MDNKKESFKIVSKGLVVYITARKRKDYRAVMVILRKTRNGKKCIVCEDYQHITREWKNHSKQLVENCSEYTIEEYLADMPCISEIRDEIEDVIQKTKYEIGPSIALKRWYPEFLKHIEVTDPDLAARLIRPRGTKAAA